MTRSRSMTLAALAGLALYAPVVLANQQSYLYGGRGLLGAPQLPFAFVEQASRSWRFAQHELWPIAPVLVLGLVVALQRKQRALVAGLLACALTSVFGERFGASVPVQLTAIALLYLVAAWAVVTGVAQIATAIRLRQEMTGEWALILGGILSVIFGLLLAVLPGVGILSLIWLIGIYAVAFGVLLLIAAFRVRGQDNQRGERPRRVT